MVEPFFFPSLGRVKTFLSWNRWRWSCNSCVISWPQFENINPIGIFHARLRQMGMMCCGHNLRIYIPLRILLVRVRQLGYNNHICPFNLFFVLTLVHLYIILPFGTSQGRPLRSTQILSRISDLMIFLLHHHMSYLKYLFLQSL